MSEQHPSFSCDCNFFFFYRYGAGLQSGHDEKRQKQLADVKNSTNFIIPQEAVDVNTTTTHNEDESRQVLHFKIAQSGVSQSMLINDRIRITKTLMA